MAGDDPTANVNWSVAEPESGVYISTDGERHYHLDIAASAAQIRSFGAERDVVVFLTKFDLNMRGKARILSALGMSGDTAGCLMVRRIHGNRPHGPVMPLFAKCAGSGHAPARVHSDYRQRIGIG